jgi:hypothetical protein
VKEVRLDSNHTCVVFALVMRAAEYSFFFFYVFFPTQRDDIIRGGYGTGSAKFVQSLLATLCDAGYPLSLSQLRLLSVSSMFIFFSLGFEFPRGNPSRRNVL